MGLQDIESLSGVVQNLAVGLAAVAAGAWALYRFRVERSLEAAMTMEVQAAVVRRGSLFMVPICLHFHNTGKVMVACKGRKSGIPVWSDSLETLYFPLSLQVRSLVLAKSRDAACFGWFDEDTTCPVPGLPQEINLLRPYETPGSEKPGFFLEPGDKATVEFLIALPEGDYLIKGTFVGMGNDEQFWTDIRYLAIPPGNSGEPGSRSKNLTS